MYLKSPNHCVSLSIDSFKLNLQKKNTWKQIIMCIHRVGGRANTEAPTNLFNSLLTRCFLYVCVWLFVIFQNNKIHVLCVCTFFFTKRMVVFSCVILCTHSNGRFYISIQRVYFVFISSATENWLKRNGLVCWLYKSNMKLHAYTNYKAIIFTWFEWKLYI